VTCSSQSPFSSDVLQPSLSSPDRCSVLNLAHGTSTKLQWFCALITLMENICVLLYLDCTESIAQGEGPRVSICPRSLVLLRRHCKGGPTICSHRVCSFKLKVYRNRFQRGSARTPLGELTTLPRFIIIGCGVGTPSLISLPLRCLWRLERGPRQSGRLNAYDPEGC